MSDRIIRLSGSHSANTISIQNLVTFLNRHEGRIFIVNSAIPEIMEIIRSAIGDALHVDSSQVSEKLVSVYRKLTGVVPTAICMELATMVKRIIRGIRLTGDYSEGLKDQLLSYSEKLTAEIFKALLEKRGMNAEVLWPETIGLQVTSEYGNATYISLNLAKMNKLPGQVYLIPGSYGITKKGRTARAGLSAADYTAAFLTKELKVSKLELWGPDRAFSRADPSIITESSPIQRLTYAEASELAYFDHYSFHPRTVEPLEGEHIPVNIVNTLSGEGYCETVINTETFVEPQIVKSVACTDDISLLRLNGPGVGLKPGILARVTAHLNHAGINIKSVITSQTSIQIILEKRTGSVAKELIRQAEFPSVREIALIDNLTLIGIIGHGIQQNCQVLAKIFGALTAKQINVELSGSGASDLATYLVVRTSDKEKSVLEIYKAFFATRKI